MMHHGACTVFCSLLWHAWMCMFMYLPIPTSPTQFRILLVISQSDTSPQIYHLSRSSPCHRQSHPNSLDSLCSVYCSIWMKNSPGSGGGGKVASRGITNVHTPLPFIFRHTLLSFQLFFAISLTCSLSVSSGGRTHKHKCTQAHACARTHTQTYACK